VLVFQPLHFFLQDSSHLQSSQFQLRKHRHHSQLRGFSSRLPKTSQIHKIPLHHQGKGRPLSEAIRPPSNPFASDSVDDPPVIVDTPLPQDRMALAGKELGTDVAQWFGPSVAAGGIRYNTKSIFFSFTHNGPFIQNTRIAIPRMWASSGRCNRQHPLSVTSFYCFSRR